MKLTNQAATAALRRPKRSGRVGLDLEILQRLHLYAVARYTGERSDRDFNAFPAAPVVLAAHTLFDAGIRAQLIDAGSRQPGVELTLRAENLTDREYVEVFGFRTTGRGVYLGGRVTWGGR